MQPLNNLLPATLSLSFDPIPFEIFEITDTIPIEVMVVPMFSLQQTPEDRFLYKLYDRGIINDKGRLLVDLSKLALPQNNEEQLESLKSLLSREFFVEVGDKDTFLHYLFTALTTKNIIDNEGNLLEKLPIDPEKVLTISNQSMPLHLAIQVLMERGVLSSEGKLTFKPDSEKINLLTKASLDFTPVLWNYLKKDDITLKIGAAYYCCCYTAKLNLYRQIFNTIPLNCDVFLFGGRARRRLLESKKFSELAFQQLFKFLNEDDIENLIPSKKLPPNTNDFHEVPDDDIKFLLSKNATKNHLFECTNKLVDLFYTRFFNKTEGGYQKEWLKKNLFTKLNVKSFDDDEFSIAALGKHKNQQIEFLFFKTISREAVFTDEIQESLTSVIKANKPSSFVSGNNREGWQALIDNVGDIFHLDKPEELSVHLFYMVITRLIRGKLFCSDDQLSFIINNTLKINNYAGIVEGFQSKNLTYLIADVCKTNINHHHPFALPYAPLAYAFTACNFLKQHLSDQDIKNIFYSIFETYPLADLEGTTFPLLQNLANAIKHDIPFSVISAAINFAGLLRMGFCHSNDSDALKVKIRDIDETSILHFEFTNSIGHKVSIWNSLTWSFETLFSFMEDSNVSESHLKILESLIEEIWIRSYSKNTAQPVLANYKKMRKCNVTLIFEQIVNLFKTTKNPVCRFYAYCAQLTLNINEESQQDLGIQLYHFISAFFCQKNLTIKTMLYDQLIYVIENSKFRATKPHIEKFFQAALKQNNSKEILISWILALAETGEKDFQLVALILWGVHSQNLEKTYEMTTLTLFKSILTSYPESLLELLFRTQENQRLTFEAEMEMISDLLNVYKLSAKGTLLLHLSKALLSFFNREHSKNISNDLKQKFMRGFVPHLRSLIKEKHFQVCMTLLVSGEMSGKIYNYADEMINVWHELSQNALTSSADAFSDDLADLIVSTKRWSEWKIEKKHSDMWLKLFHTLCKHAAFSESIPIWEKLCAFSFINNQKVSDIITELLTTDTEAYLNIITACNFLQISNNLDYQLWFQCFGKITNKANSTLAEHGLSSFLSVVSKQKTETSIQAAHCWSQAIHTLPLVSKPMKLEIYRQAINPKSHLFLAFNDPSLTKEKIMTWKLLALILIQNPEEKASEVLNVQIAKLRENLPDYRKANLDCLKELLFFEHQLLHCILQNGRYKEISQFLSPQIIELMNNHIELSFSENERNEVTPTIKNIFLVTLQLIYKRIEFTNENLFEDARKIFNHPYARKRFGLSEFSQHFGNYLISHINYCHNNKTIDREMCFLTILNNMRLLRHNEDIETICYDKCIELLIHMMITNEKFSILEFSNYINILFTNINLKFINRQDIDNSRPTNTFNNFGEFSNKISALTFSSSYSKLTKKYYIPDYKTNPNTIILHCATEFQDDPQFIKFRSEFFIYMKSLIKNLTTNIDTNPKNINLIYTFVFLNLQNLINQHPDEKEIIAKLIYYFTVMIKIRSIAFFEQHARNSSLLLNRAIEQGLYKDQPGLLIEALCYILKSDQIPKDILANQKYHDDAYTAIHRFMSIQSQDGLVLSLIAFQQIFDTFNVHLDKVKLQNELIKFTKFIGQNFYFQAIYPSNIKLDAIKNGQFAFSYHIVKLFLSIPPTLDFNLEFFKIAFNEYKTLVGNPKTLSFAHMQIFESFFVIIGKDTITEIINTSTHNPDETLKSCEKYYSFLNSILPDMVKYTMKHEKCAIFLNILIELMFLKLKKTPTQTSQKIHDLRNSSFEIFLKNIRICKPAKPQALSNVILDFCKAVNTKLSLNVNIVQTEGMIKRHLLKK